MHAVEKFVVGSVLGGDDRNFENPVVKPPRADMLRWDRPSTDDERLTMIREPRTDLSVRPEKD
jgi:hypothetical protein